MTAALAWCPLLGFAAAVPLAGLAIPTDGLRVTHREEGRSPFAGWVACRG